MIFKIIMEPDDDGVVAYCPQLPGCVSFGRDRREALHNVQEALALYARSLPEMTRDQASESPASS